jgi:hypothetical protein
MYIEKVGKYVCTLRKLRCHILLILCSKFVDILKLVLLEHDSKVYLDSKEIDSALSIHISRYDLTFGKKFPMQGDSGSSS